MNIFITGINGVLGSTLAKELRLRGHRVVGCDLTHSADPNVVRADIAEVRQLRDAFEVLGGNGTYDLCYHFAAEFGRVNGEDFYEQLWKSNCIGTRNVINECLFQNIPMIFASSSEAYGLSELYSEGRALYEEMLDVHPPQFHNEYALTKYTNERQIFMSVRNDGLKAVVFRFFNVYGPPETYSPYRSVVCQFAWRLLHGLPITVNREGKRSHLWIGDWVKTVANTADVGMLRRLLGPPTIPWPGAGGTFDVPVFNIGGEEYESVERLYLLLKEVIKEIPNIPESPVNYVDTEPANSATKQPDNIMAQVFLNHKSEMPLESGLRKTVYELLRIKKERRYDN